MQVKLAFTLKLNLFIQFVLLITFNSAVPLLTAASLISAHLFCSLMLLIILTHHLCCSHHHSVRHIMQSSYQSALLLDVCFPTQSAAASHLCTCCNTNTTAGHSSHITNVSWMQCLLMLGLFKQMDIQDFHPWFCYGQLPPSTYSCRCVETIDLVIDFVLSICTVSIENGVPLCTLLL